MPTPPPPRISPLLAKLRHKVFTDFKNVGLQSSPIHKKETEQITYDPDAFKQLLEALTQNANWDGVRVYFANYTKNSNVPHPNNDYIPAGCDNKFTLIFVPTKKSSSGFHDDILNECRIIDRNNQVQVLDASATSGDANIAARWVQAYQDNELHHFNDDGIDETGDNNFLETRCMWYDRHLIVKTNPDGLLSIISNLGNNLESVIVLIAGYLSGETFSSFDPELIEYQLSLVFHFHIKGEPDAFTKKKRKTSENEELFYSLAFRDFDKEYQAMILARGVNADTGNPCPPPKTGCKSTATNEGARLPNA